MKKYIPFTEKYRPKNYNDLIIDKIIKTKIESIIQSKEMPNMILTGKSGIGKTATIHCIVKAIYAKENIPDAILELNACDDRGIKTVQDTIVNFCKKKIDFIKNYAQHKLVILDEADNITPKAQRLINLIMDKYTNTKIVFICNNTTDIIESIQSRAVIIRFSKPPLDKVIERLELICNKENILFEKNALKLIFDFSQKDIRQTINMLELIYYSLNKDDNIITIEKINDLCDIPPQTLMNELLNSILTKDIRNIIKILKSFQENGYYSQDVLLHFIQHLQYYINTLNVVNPQYDQLINILNNLAYSAYDMSKTNSTFLQLTSSIVQLL